MISDTTQIGLVGELAVALDLARHGFSPSFAPEGLRYDLLFENEGVIKKVQVKACAGIRIRPKRTSHNYQFTTYGSHSKEYQTGDFDIIACHAIDIGVTAYLTLEEIKNIRVPNFGVPGVAKRSKDAALGFLDEYPLRRVL